MTATAQLPMFEDETVQQSQIRVVGAGDGLSEALKTEIEKKLAEKLLADAADALEKAKADAQGQLLLDGEEAAAAHEARD